MTKLKNMDLFCDELMQRLPASMLSLFAAIRNGSRFINFNVLNLLDSVKTKKRPDLASFSLKECCDEVLDFLDLSAF